jgi:hypothetical protein
LKHRFFVVVTCQENSCYYAYKYLVGALFGYAYHYIKKKKYGTMNFVLKEAWI